MRESIQKILDALYDAVSKESDAAAAKLRDAFSSLAQQFESRGDEAKVLESRIETLEREIAELKSKLPTDT